MFLPFHRGSEGAANAKGIGLGLAIAKSLVEKMGSSIQIESTEGQGSAFSFQVTFDVAPVQSPQESMDPLPSPLSVRIEPTHQDPPMTSMVPSGTDLRNEFKLESPLRFLVVDDNAINKTLFERTVNNMMKKKKHAQTPVYTFASNGLQRGLFLFLSVVTL